MTTHPLSTAPAAPPRPRASAEGAEPEQAAAPIAVREGEPIAEEGGGWRRSFLSALYVWLAARFAYAILTVLAHQLAPEKTPSLVLAWFQWDATHYYRIALLGYAGVPQSVAFFPLYPLLSAAADPVLPGNLLIAALIVSNVSAYGALVLLHRLATTEFDLPTADRTIFFLSVFPTAYFLAAPYNHSLFLLLCVGCLYAIRRHAWWVAGIAGALASGTRSAGILLLLPFAYEYWRVNGRRVRWDAAAIALVPGGLVAFAWYCWRARGDALAFSHAQEFWGKGLDWPGHTIWLAVRQLFERSPAENYHLIGDLGGTALGLALLVACFVGPWALRRDQWYLVAFAGPAFLLPLFFPLAEANPISGTARYLLDVGVLFMLAARAGRHPAVERSYVVVALALQFGYLLMYLRGLWTF
jgi:hypothetical protein